jgi:hypothetical protein
LKGDHPRIISAKFGWDWLSSYRNSHKNLLVWNHLLNKNKFWWNSHWMVLFQKYVWRFGPLTKMAPTTELC